MGIIANINDSECIVTEDHVLSYTFPDGKEYIFSLKANMSVIGYNAVCRRGQGLLLNLPEDLEYLREAKEEHFRFYILDPNQAVFKANFICLHERDENLTLLMRERYKWLLEQFY